MSMLYEILLLSAVVFVASYLFVGLARDAQSGWPRTIFQIYLLSVCGVYFVSCWTRGGQTLPMKTWRIRLVARDGTRISAARAARRYLFALASTVLGGAGYWWALIDRDEQFLHDRLAGTKIIKDEGGRMNNE